jgi:hypothetical protein
MLIEHDAAAVTLPETCISALSGSAHADAALNARTVAIVGGMHFMSRILQKYVSAFFADRATPQCREVPLGIEPIHTPRCPLVPSLTSRQHTGSHAARLALAGTP